MASEHRRQEALQPPQSHLSFSTFPSFTPQATDSWYRQHKLRATSDHGLWHFTSASKPPVGRFDLPAPRGTCYFASTQLAAVMELIGPDHAVKGWVPAGLMLERVVSQILSPGDSRLADLVHSEALKFGVTNEIATTIRYNVTNAWAESFDRSGFTGIRYRPRFSPGEAFAFALFGKSGVPTRPAAWDESPASVREVVEGAGLHIVDPPSSTSVSIVSPS